MDPRAARQQIFRPLNDAVSDAWLQVRARPVLYLLIWLSLALAPQFLPGLIFQDPIIEAMEDYFAMFDQVDVAELSASGELPENYSAVTTRILSMYGALMLFNSLVAVFMGAVMAGTVSRFRERRFPKYIEALKDGAHLYPGFLVSVLAAVGRILLRALVVGVGIGILGRITGSQTLPFFGSLLGFLFFMNDLNRYGLAPFVHLSLRSRARDSLKIARAFHRSHRPVVTSLFLSLVILPLLFILLLYSLVLSAGFAIGPGVFLLWFLQSLIQFGIVMVLINFARNTFIEVSQSPAGEAAVEGKESDIVGQAEEIGKDKSVDAEGNGKPIRD